MSRPIHETSEEVLITPIKNKITQMNPRERVFPNSLHYLLTTLINQL